MGEVPLYAGDLKRHRKAVHGVDLEIGPPRQTSGVGKGVHGIDLEGPAAAHIVGAGEVGDVQSARGGGGCVGCL